MPDQRVPEARGWERRLALLALLALLLLGANEVVPTDRPADRDASSGPRTRN